MACKPACRSGCGFAGNDRFDAAILELLAQVVAVVGLVAEQLRGALGTPQQAPTERIVVRLAAGQEDGEKVSLSICECVDLRVAPGARAAGRLALRPPFPPRAERCALPAATSLYQSTGITSGSAYSYWGSGPCSGKGDYKPLAGKIADEIANDFNQAK